jgi:hypothetical protein
MASVITPERIGELIGDAPGWALVALTIPNERLGAEARRELGEHVFAALYQPLNVETEQLRLQL